MATPACAAPRGAPALVLGTCAVFRYCRVKYHSWEAVSRSRNWNPAEVMYGGSPASLQDKSTEEEPEAGHLVNPALLIQTRGGGEPLIHPSSIHRPSNASPNPSGPATRGRSCLRSRLLTAPCTAGVMLEDSSHLEEGAGGASAWLTATGQVLST